VKSYALTFKTESFGYDILTELLKIIGVDKYRWLVDDSNIYSSCTLNNILTKGTYSGNEILEELTERHFVVLVSIKGFCCKDKVTSVSSYKDFVSGTCKVALFIVDCNICAIYVKEKNIYEKIKKYVSKIQSKEIRIISEETADMYFGV